MGTEYAPDAIRWLGAQAVAKLGGEVSGVLGDSSHTYGYHRCRNVLPSSDYSVQLPADLLGDGWAASALDISFPSAVMPVVTQRLLDSAKDRNDPRLDVVREFFGTLDHSTVTGWDCVAYTPSTSDSSHLWHIHISILRQFSNDMAAMQQILSVLTGEPVSQSGGKTVSAVDNFLNGYAQGMPKYKDDAGNDQINCPVAWEISRGAWQKTVDVKLDALANRPAATLTDAQVASIAQAVVKQIFAKIAAAGA